ncbi:low molecular weight phosphatase family protein [Actinoplanes rectilineatus]|uniref:arsenate reductase/protein-tyrosine-phosphatase family protein n=1 Tax=Actinoplanes rectilineatus TaxID=113571 RepID=UPI0005F2A90C|nr:low molecular weight phosphatase family protein [Actinoplanes rectilineatus]
MSDLDAFLDQVRTSLTTQFAEAVGAETVGRYVNESYVALYRTAHADQQLPDKARRFTVDRLTALAQATGALGKPVPEALFLCIHNAGRSQMAAALMAHHGRGRVNARSAGSQPDATVSKSATAVLAEIGVDLAGAFPKPLTDDVLRAADVVVIAGGGDACPRVPGPRYDVWDLPHPPGSDLDAVRAVRDDIDARVQKLLAELTA